MMKRTIVVTDLTRFQNPDIVCTAGIDRESGECIRPMPYLKSAVCRKLRILPGAILSGEFSPTTDRSGPHQEDYHYTNLRFEGPCTSSEFKKTLKSSCYPSVGTGFETTLPQGEKCIPVSHSGTRSIITISVSVKTLQIVEDNYKPGKIRVHFTDGSGYPFRFISISDLGFHDFALEHHALSDLKSINQFIQSQEELYLRLGLSRAFQAQNGKNGYWIQANGIYTFPDFNQDIRSYS